MMNNYSHNDVEIKKEEDVLALKEIMYKSVNEMSLEPSPPKQAFKEMFEQVADKRVRYMVRELGDRAKQYNSAEL